MLTWFNINMYDFQSIHIWKTVSTSLLVRWRSYNSSEKTLMTKRICLHSIILTVFCSSVSTKRHQEKHHKDVHIHEMCGLSKYVGCELSVIILRKSFTWMDKKFPTIFPWLLENENILHNFHFQMTSIYFH